MREVVTQRPNRTSGGTVIVSDARGPDGGYDVRCSAHNAIITVNSPRKAFEAMVMPSNWCPQCAAKCA